MQARGFFESLGEFLGEIIRFIVDLLGAGLAAVAGAMRDFLHGLAASLGIDPSLLGFALLLIGLALLYGAFRSFIRRRFAAGAIYLVLALLMLSWLIR